MNLPRSTYYQASANKPEEVEIVAMTDEFARYGYRRVAAELRARGLVVNAKKVRSLIRENDLNPRQRRRFVATTDSDHDEPIFPNLAKDVTVDRPNRLPRAPRRPLLCSRIGLWPMGRRHYLRDDRGRLRLPRGDPRRLVARGCRLCAEPPYRRPALSRGVARGHPGARSAPGLRAPLRQRLPIRSRSLPRAPAYPRARRFHGPARTRTTMRKPKAS